MAVRVISVRRAEPHERASYLKNVQRPEDLQNDAVDPDNPPMDRNVVLVPFGPILDRRRKEAADAYKDKQDTARNKDKITVKPST